MKPILASDSRTRRDIGLKFVWVIITASRSSPGCKSCKIRTFPRYTEYPLEVLADSRI